MPKEEANVQKFLEIVSSLTDRELSITIFTLVDKKPIARMAKIYRISEERVRQIQVEAVLKIIKGLKNLCIPSN